MQTNIVKRSAVRIRWLNVIRHEGPKRALRAAAQALFRRDTDMDETRIAFNVLQDWPGPRTMIDVGAHHGSSLQPFLRAGWYIHAFEPDPQNREWLARRYGSYPNLHVDDRAVGDAESEAAPFFRSDESSGISSLSAFHASHRPADSVSVTTLANVISDSEHLRKQGVAFLKIDTEGHDLMVLRGLPWDSVSPAVIVTEFEDAKTHPLGYGYHDIATYLTRRGYSVMVSEWYPVTRYGTKHDWRRCALYPCELADEGGWGNLIATREPVIADRLKARCVIDPEHPSRTWANPPD